MVHDAQKIEVRGAREHNLRNASLVLPTNQLICFTGVSGSGKSSFAFDTLYAEGQRRYIESLSAYARQFLGQLRKPDVDLISGLSPSIAIQQKAGLLNPRSTVGTMTQIHDFLRVLFACLGRQHCPRCNKPITAQSREQILAQVREVPWSRALLLAPVVRAQKGEFRDLFEDLITAGYARARVDGAVISLHDAPTLARHHKHDIEVVVDRLKPATADRARLTEAIDNALRLGEGSVWVADADGPDDVRLSSRYACTACSVSFEPPTPQMFSFNAPAGMCPTCSGLGQSFTFDPDLLVPDPSLSVLELAVAAMRTKIGKWRKHIFAGVAKHKGFDLNMPWESLGPEAQRALLFGTGDDHITFEWKWRGGIWRHGGTFDGIVPDLEEKYRKARSGMARRFFEKFMRQMRCPECHGARLNAQARAVRMNKRSLAELESAPIAELHAFVSDLKLNATEQIVATELLKEIRGRLDFLLDVGLHYLALDRTAPTLSGGESQRIRLAAQIGSGLVGVLYVLDEPSIGLHPRDQRRLIESLVRLRDIGNTVVVVEHDEDTMRAADMIVDFGPGPGVRGGHIVAHGTIAKLKSSADSVTGAYLAGRKEIPTPAQRRPVDVSKKNQPWLTVQGAAHNNLKDIEARIPLQRFVCVTGVSGSGKSSLARGIIREQLMLDLNGATTTTPGKHKRITGIEHLDKIIDIDQSPIGRTPRSNPATYIKLFDVIRSLYAELPEAKMRGYKPGRFSFNVPTGSRGGGRCEACEGNGSNKVEMEFLADVWVDCPVCDGQRFNRETLQVRFKGKSIADVLDMDVQEGLTHFQNIPKVEHMLQTLHEVGLDYLKLGQSSTTLSGGEAQRIKLARELVKRSTGQTFYILDEPTTGLHFEDINRLLTVLHGFVDRGNTVLVIEHHLDVIKTADWIIDLGPDGGAGGGEIVGEGTPEQIIASDSATGQALSDHLCSGQSSSTRRRRAARRKPVERNISIRGARQHNLNNVSLDLPRNQTTVFTGLSGSGKSSLAMDTLYTEGHRRYVESLSTYARQFLGQLQKPQVDHISGLPPAIAIEQKSASQSPRSTVGTVTEIYDYLRLLFARIGQAHCPQCDAPISTASSEEIAGAVQQLPAGTKLLLLAPLPHRKSSARELLDQLRSAGYTRVRVDGKVLELTDCKTLPARRKIVEAVVDRIAVNARSRSRIAESVEQALTLGQGRMVAHIVDEDRDMPFSQRFGCNDCGGDFSELSPLHFSFNNRLGWCTSCEGLGTQLGAPIDQVVVNPQRSVLNGAIAGWSDLNRAPMMKQALTSVCAQIGFDASTPWSRIDAAHQQAFLHGLDEPTWLAITSGAGMPVRVQWKGLFPAIDQATKASWHYRAKFSTLVTDVPCQVCRGSRLAPLSRAVRVSAKTGELGIHELCSLPLGDALDAIKNLKLNARQKRIAGELIQESVSRLRFLLDLGLNYLSLNRSSPTLSGGESQRIRLASQLGSGLTGVLYVLDEPTIGLHPRDNRRLIAALQRLRDTGNTLCIVEHDPDVIDSADRIVDFGPGAGADGGHVVAATTPKTLKRSAKSLTGKYLSGKAAIVVPIDRRPVDESVPTLGVRGAWHHNLKNIDVDFPLGRLIAVTGVSGSGKSSLVNDVLYGAMATRLSKARVTPGGHEDLHGVEYIDKVSRVDQTPIGNTPSSNPATYTGVFDVVRELYTRMPEARIRGYTPARFSFNRPGGRCEKCSGVGQVLVEMHFLPDVWVMCDECNGQRYNPETLAVQYRGKSIAETLNMRIEHAAEHFDQVPKIRAMLKTLIDVGLGYVALGQPATTLSGGEAQRVKLAAELGKPSTGRTMYVLDEPTTGLHFDDTRRLLEVLQQLCELGNTVICIEHNLDLIKTADWIIDIGPEAGDQGGDVVAVGPPEVVAQSKSSRSAAPLLAALERGPRGLRPRIDVDQAMQRQEVIQGRLKLQPSDTAIDLPWEKNGRRWHVEQCLGADGQRPRWEPEALIWLVDEMACQSGMGEPDWNHRSRIELKADGSRKMWFCHILTRGNWLLECTFRVPKRSFDAKRLLQDLKILTLDQREELPVYGQWQRIKRKPRRQYDDIRVWVHDLAEIKTTAFKKFVKEAAAAHCTKLSDGRKPPEDREPWKHDGRKWHLSQSGISSMRQRQWKPAALVELVGRVTKAVPCLELDWNHKTQVALRHPSMKCAWGKIMTNQRQGLRVEFCSGTNTIGATQIEKLGEDPTIKRGRKFDTVTFWLQEMKQVDSRLFSRLLKEAEASLAL
jgi:excinuclease ABC subunit A